MGGTSRGKGKSRNKEQDFVSSSSDEESENEQEQYLDPDSEAKRPPVRAKAKRRPAKTEGASSRGAKESDGASKSEKETPNKKESKKGSSDVGNKGKASSRGKTTNSSGEVVDSSKRKGASKGETRIDPESGSEVTFQELCLWYTGYSQADLWDYWDSCWPVETKRKGGKGKGNGKGKENTQDDPYEMRIDPNDGCAYTFEELRLYYRNDYDKKTIATYWEETCYLPKKRGKKAESKVGAPSLQKELVVASRDRSERKSGTPKEREATKEKPSRESRGPKPKLYMGSFSNTEELASSLSKDGWWSMEPNVGDAKHNRSILVPSGREINSLSEAMHSETAMPLPMGLRARAEKLGELLEELFLAGGEGDFLSYAFAFLPGDADLQDSLLDALGIRKTARYEAVMDTTAWENDFTDQQLESDVTPELCDATQMLKDFGQTYEMNFSENVSCAPVLYFAQSDCSIDRPVLGVLHTRLWK